MCLVGVFLEELENEFCVTLSAQVYLQKSP